MELEIASPLFVVDSSTEGDQRNSTTADLGNGRLLISWIDNRRDGNGYSIESRIFDYNGNALTDPFQVNTHTISDQVNPSIQTFTDGSFAIAWQSFGQDEFRSDIRHTIRDGQYGVFTQRFEADGSRIGDENQVNTTVRGNQTEPQFVLLDDGGYIISWQHINRIYDPEEVDGPFFGNTHFGQRYLADGTPVGEEFEWNIRDADVFDSLDNFHNVQFYPLPNGEVVGIFTQVGGSTYVAHFSQQGELNGEPYSTEGSELLGSAEGSAFAVLPDGGYVVAAEYAETNKPGKIWVQRFDSSGAPTGELILVAEEQSGPSTHIWVYDVIALSDGGFIVSWAQDYRWSRAVSVQIYNSDGSARGEVTELSPPNMYAYPQEISLLEGDRILVSWSSNTGFSHGLNYGLDVFAQVYQLPEEGSASLFTEESDAVVLPGALHSVIALEGDDSITGTYQADTIRGGAGADDVAGAGGNDYLLGEEGDDQLTGGLGQDIILGNQGTDILLGNAGNDYLSGGQGGDTLKGGAGDDTILGGAGQNSIWGGAGNDLIMSSTREDMPDYVDERIELNVSNFVLGGQGDDTIFGQFGHDTLVGGRGNDLIDGGRYGYDSLTGGSGDDEISNGLFNYGNSGNDTIYLTELGNVLAPWFQPGVIHGGKGIDTLSLATAENSGRESWVVDFSTGQIFRGNTLGYYSEEEYAWSVRGIENVSATNGSIHLTFIGNSRGNTVSIGYSDNHVSTAGGDDVVVSAVTQSQVVRRSNYNVTRNTIDTGSGNDSVWAGTSDDRIHGGKGDDFLSAGWFNDTVKGGSGDDHILGGHGKDFLKGGEGSDIVIGGAGHDTVAGNSGNDQLTGGGGQDVFVFNGRREMGDDTITDFSIQDDVISFGKGIELSDLEFLETEGSTIVTWSSGSIYLSEVLNLDETHFLFS